MQIELTDEILKITFRQFLMYAGIRCGRRHLAANTERQAARACSTQHVCVCVCVCVFENGEQAPRKGVAGLFIVS